eukprot:692105-Amphidinium_carterae.1
MVSASSFWGSVRQSLPANLNGLGLKCEHSIPSWYSIVPALHQPFNAQDKNVKQLSNHFFQASSCGTTNNIMQLAKLDNAIASACTWCSLASTFRGKAKRYVEAINVCQQVPQKPS